MTNQEKLEIIKKANSCFLHSKSDVESNTKSYLQNKDDFFVDVTLISRNSSSTYFKNHFYSFNRGTDPINIIPYKRIDNDKELKILEWLDDVVLIESISHDVLWVDDSIKNDYPLLKLTTLTHINKYKKKEEKLQAELKKERNSIEIKGKRYTKEQLERIFDNLSGIINTIEPNQNKSE